MNVDISLNDLIKFIKSKNVSKFNDLLNFKDLLSHNITNWVGRVKMSDGKYTKNILFRNENIEIIIISWLPGQHTKLHSHPKNGCILKILEGELNEIIFNNGIMNEHKLKSKEVSFMHDNMGKHIISNVTNNTAISLHIYSPPNFYN